MSMKPLTFHLHIPERSAALLWDMDGVLLDSLQHDIDICGALFSSHLGQAITFAPEFIRSVFAYDPARFIDALLAHHRLEVTSQQRQHMLEDYLTGRRTTAFPVLAGVHDTLRAAQGAGLAQAVVSNNATHDIRAILDRSGLASYFSAVIGNDLLHHGQPVRKKPAPDMYLYASAQLGVPADRCVVFEDSALGCTAGLEAGAHVIGLLTGSASLEELRGLSPRGPHQIYQGLTHSVMHAESVPV